MRTVVKIETAENLITHYVQVVCLPNNARRVLKGGKVETRHPRRNEGSVNLRGTSRFCGSLRRARRAPSSERTWSSQRQQTLPFCPLPSPTSRHEKADERQTTTRTARQGERARRGFCLAAEMSDYRQNRMYYLTRITVKKQQQQNLSCLQYGQLQT